MRERVSTATRGYDGRMQDAGQFAAALIRAGTPAYAASAARRLLERQGSDAFPLELWRESLAARLRDLTAALAEGDPSSFVEQIRWNRAAYAARSVDEENLRHELEALREVFREELPGAARSTADEYLDVALDALSHPLTAVERLDPADERSRLALRYVTALLEGDRREALRLVLEPVRKGELAPARLMLDVLLPAQRELGRMWHAGEIGVAEEHFVTRTTQSAMDRALAYAEPAPSNGKTVLIAAATGDAHDLGLQAVAHLFELDGWRVVLPGADLPAREIAEAVSRFQPDLLAIGATLGWQRAALAETVREARAAHPVRVLVGGLAFHGEEAQWRRAGADGFAASAPDAVAIGRELVGLPPSTSNAPR